jgi:hypothetical protein
MIFLYLGCASLEIGLHRFDQFFGAAAAFGVAHGIDDVKPNMVLDNFGHETAHGAARRDDQMQHRGAALFLFERALDSFDLAAHAPGPV